MIIAYALWMVGLLSAIALSLLAMGSTSRHLSHHTLTATRNDAAIEAAIARAVLALVDPRPDKRWRVDGVPHDFSFSGQKMQVAIQDELGRIDLNHADQSLLAGLLQSAGVETAPARALVDKLLDWREPLPGKRVNGANEADYRAAGFAYRPRGGPLQSVEELKLVMGITPALYSRIEPAVTVYSGRRFIDPQFAPREALAAVASINSSAAASVLEARRHQGARAGIIDPPVTVAGRAFGIKVNLVDGATRLTREIVIRITDNPAQPYWILNWRTK